jgi:hypothetical protein
MVQFDGLNNIRFKRPGLELLHLGSPTHIIHFTWATGRHCCLIRGDKVFCIHRIRKRRDQRQSGRDSEEKRYCLYPEPKYGYIPPLIWHSQPAEGTLKEQNS